jgi:SAM-dependent methyltransferase
VHRGSSEKQFVTASHTTKDFGEIQSHYAFFETHSTEAAEDVAAYGRVLDDLWNQRPRPSPLRMLDFGCGPGGFTGKFLKQLNLPRETLALSLVEPVDAYRETAVRQLSAYTVAAVQATPSLPEITASRYDLILSNHVLYYVPDLQEAVAGLLSKLADGGVLLTSMAGDDNTLIQLWKASFKMLGQPVPYNTREDLEQAFAVAGITPAGHKVRYHLEFADTDANRESLLRFLLSDYFEQLPRQTLLDLLNPYVSPAGMVLMPMQHDHFCWQQPSARRGCVGQ